MFNSKSTFERNVSPYSLIIKYNPMESIIISPSVKSKWLLEIYQKNEYTRYCLSDWLFCDFPIVYDNWLVVYDFPERLPKYVKKFIQKAIWSKEFLYLYK